MYKIFDKYSSLEVGLIWTAIAVGAITFVLGIGLFVMWIKYSWIEKENSLNYSGKDLTEKIFSENNINVEIKRSLFYSKFWNHNKRKQTYRLRNWTYDRRSIWTMMEASQQAYATTIRETNKKQFWIAFRIPQLVMMFGGLLGVGLTAWGIHTIATEATSIKEGANWKTYSLIIIGMSVLFAASIYATCWRAWCLKKNVLPLIQNIGFNQHELKAIQRIFNWAFLYSIANAILQTINLALSTMNRSDSSNSWR